MTISATQVMDLRNATGAGLMDCKRALEETNGDPDEAKDYLRKKGVAIAAKKSSRETKEGGIGIRLSDDCTHAAIVHLACETDFVSRNDQFNSLLDQLSKQVLENGNNDLLNQQVTEGTGTVQELITNSISKMGENLQLVDSARMDLEGEGLVGSYVHSNKRIGVLVKVTGVSRNEPLEILVKDLAMHIAASQVHAINADGIDPKVIEKEKEIYLAQAKESGKPDDIAEKMVLGRMKKFIKEVSLVDQPFVKDPAQSIQAMFQARSSELGGTVKIDQFIKFQF